MSATGAGGPERSGCPAYGRPPAGYRLPDATRLGPVRLQVASLADSVAWYSRVLGLHPIERAETEATMGTRGGTPLVRLEERAGTRPVREGSRLGLYHVALLLPSRAALGRLLRHLAWIREPIGASDHLVSEALYLHDPDGLGIEVYADRPRSAWAVDGLELRMATDPLDGPGLLAAAGEAPGEGMPDGTVIGHVHLHVGDLDLAGRFYGDAVGFDRMVWRYPGALFLGAGGYHHHLGTNTWARGASPAGDLDARLLEWTIELPTTGDVAAVADSLRAAGHLVTLGTDGAVVADPWGTRLRLYGTAETT